MRHHRRLREPALLFALLAMLATTVGAGAATVRHAAAGPVRGGTVSIGFPGDMVTFDPAQAVGDDWEVMNGTLFDGLYQYDRNGTPQLDLAAAAPTISKDRTVWTFHLRKGVLFSNSTELTAADVKFSFTRILDPHLKPAASWGQTTEAVFQGAQDVVAGKAKTVSGIRVLDRYTIRFVLVHPIAIFPDILAETFNFVVPQAVVSRDSPDYFASHPVGTGPFELQSWTKGTQAVFVRNPHYFKAATGKPYLDRIIVHVNVPASVLALKIEKGEIDGFGDASQASAADIRLARSDPRYARYLVQTPTIYAIWLDLNVHADPLTKRAIRQAVAMAIDRAHLVRLLGGQAIPASQIYIPLMPQHDPRLDQQPVYPYDPRKAAALLKASGYHGQPVTVLYPSNFPYDAGMAPGIQQDLQRIGLSVTLRGVSSNSLSALTGPLTGHQISIGAWAIDFPDAYDVYSGDMSCAANTAGGYSGAHYCDPAADSLANAAESLPLGAARNALLRRAQTRFLQAAATVPLVYLKQVEMVSPRVGGFYYEPIFGWQFASYWLKP